MKKYNVYWVVLCKNEEDIIPFCIDYWKRIADKVIVYDNGSTDSSIELLSKYDWIEIRHFETEGQNDPYQKQVKELAYKEFRDQATVIIISDMDEVFYFENLEKELDKMINGNYDAMILPLYSLCEDKKPEYEEGKLLHQLCHKFYKQRMNHMENLQDFTKISIFNTNTVLFLSMSVGQHFVYTVPTQNLMIDEDAFGLHIDKGFGLDYKFNIRQKMLKNLSKTNKQCGMCIEYSKDYKSLKEEYENNQKHSFDINL